MIRFKFTNLGVKTIVFCSPRTWCSLCLLVATDGAGIVRAGIVGAVAIATATSVTVVAVTVVVVAAVVLFDVVKLHEQC